jgi:2-polyprenyl-6-methoxyphenol hydroxylase-like FAD-dependent oxidoreductase
LTVAERGLLIVGAGPTGLTAAVELVRRGIMPRIVDRKPEPSPLCRAVGINAHSLTLLEESGVSERLLAEGMRVGRARMHDGATPIGEIRLDLAPHKYNFMLCLPQDRTESILLERFRALGGDVEFGVSLDGLTLAGETASVTLNHDADQRVEEAEYATVLGADGARSTAREAAGLSYDGFDLDGAWGVADVDSAAWPHQEMFCGFLLPGGDFVVILPIQQNRYRVVANRENPLALVPGGMPVDNIRREASFDIAIRQAPSYRQGAVLLAGDAAHCHSPAGGRGMNLGMADACSFARRYSENDLDGYSVERHRHGKATIAASEAGRRNVMAGNPAARFMTRTGIRLISRLPFLQKRVARTVLDI